MGLLQILSDLINAREDSDQEKALDRNELCWCGSGKKYKKCHLIDDEKKSKKSSACCGST